MSIEKTETTDELIERGFDFFAKHFPDSEKPDKLGIGPGRVNLIGEHTDYNDGFVLPMVSYKMNNKNILRNSVKIKKRPTYIVCIIAV